MALVALYTYVFGATATLVCVGVKVGCLSCGPSAQFRSDEHMRALPVACLAARVRGPDAVAPAGDSRIPCKLRVGVSRIPCKHAAVLLARELPVGRHELYTYSTYTAWYAEYPNLGTAETCEPAKCVARSHYWPPIAIPHLAHATKHICPNIRP